MQPPPQAISTIKELAERVALVDSSEGMDRHNAMYSINFQLDLSSLKGLDPFSAEYKMAVLRLYEFVHASPYQTASESDVLEYDVENPYPFSSRSQAVVGAHIGAIATLLRDFPATPPASVLDVGVGWGHTSLLLARTGYDVDALDINQGYLRLVDKWAERTGVTARLRTMNVTFSEVGDLPKTYDAILFFESFHHSIDHDKLIEDCAKLLSPGGAIVFAGEPIYLDWPVSWSIRSDSLSAYCIHKFGWMELGFSEDYFLELLFSKGLYAERRQYIEHPVASGYVARRAVGHIPLPPVLLSRAYDATWHAPDVGMRWTTGESLLPGSILGAQFGLALVNHRSTRIRVDILGDAELLAHATLEPGEARTINVSRQRPLNVVTIRSEAWSPADFGSADTRTLGVAVTHLVLG